MWNRSIFGVTEGCDRVKVSRNRQTVLVAKERAIESQTGIKLSDKRPETSADIVSRGHRVSGRNLAYGSGRNRFGKKRGYSVDLGSHMAECDANYHRLLRLFPDLRDSDSKGFSLHLPGFQADVVFAVKEKGPYTTVLHLKVDTDQTWMGMATMPEMSIRVYHDAKSAEVIEYQNQNRFHGKYDYPNNRMRQRDEKAQLNRFLGEFLNLCLEHGASNTPVSF